MRKVRFLTPILTFPQGGRSFRYKLPRLLFLFPDIIRNNFAVLQCYYPMGSFHDSYVMCLKNECHPFFMIQFFHYIEKRLCRF